MKGGSESYEDLGKESQEEKTDDENYLSGNELPMLEELQEVYE